LNEQIMFVLITLSLFESCIC